MKILNNTGSSVELWGTSLATEKGVLVAGTPEVIFADTSKYEFATQNN